MDGFIDALSPEAEKRITAYNKQVIELIGNIGKASSVTVGGKTPSQTDSAIKDLNTQLLKQDEIIKKLQGDYLKLAETEEKVSRSKKTQTQIILDQAKSYQSLAAQREKAIAQSTKEEARLAASQTLYSKLGQKLALLRAEYSELAVKQQLRGRLSDEESKRLDFLTQKTQKYVMAQDAVNTTMGKYQQRVGAYGGQFNALGNSINQLTREMPSFTYSVQTGFMALSNNIPIFTDAIGNAIAQNKILQAEGKPTTSVLKQLAGAFFSWQTALGIGITLLTVYGKEIGDYISKSFESAKATDAMVEARKQLNDASLKGQKAAVEETISLKSLLAIAKDTALSYRERVIAVNELQDTYPAYFGNLTKEQILAGQTAEAERQLTKAILARAKANAAVEKITENQSKIIDIEVERLNIRKELDVVNAQILKTEKELQNSANVTNSQGIALSQNYDRQKKLISEINKLSGDKATLDKINNILTDYAIQNEKDSILLKEKKAKVEKENNREKLTAISLENQNTDAKNALISKLEEEIAINKKLRDEASTNIEQYRQFDEVVRSLSDALDLIKNPDKYMSKDVSGLKAQQEAIKKHKEGIEALEKAMRNYAKGFEDTFVNNAGFKTTFDILNGNIIGFGSNVAVTALAIKESFQEMFNFINQISQENFDAQRERLQQEKEISLAFAGDSDTARAEIERQAEQRRKEIDRREFKAKKEQAKFNIILNTAQAVVAALPNFVLAAIVAAIGAAELIAVSSQPVPAYKSGTDNHKGGLMLVNDGNGSNFAETIQTPDGNIYQPTERNVFMNAPKGTKVFTHDQWQKNLDSILMSNEINYAQPNVVVNSGMSDAQVDRIVSSINNKSEAHLNIDKNGFNVKIRNGHTTKEILNNQVTFGR